jgi:hypothetical protein
MIKDIRSTRPLNGALVITGVRGYHQLDRFSCGHALACALVESAYGRLPVEDRWRLQGVTAPNPEEGTTTERLQEALGRYDLEMSRVAGLRGITRSLHKGNLVACSLQLATQRGNDLHWMMIAGVNRDGDILLLNHTGLPGSTKVWWSWEKAKAATLGFSDCFYSVNTELESYVEDRRRSGMVELR